MLDPEAEIAQLSCIVVASQEGVLWRRRLFTEIVIGSGSKKTTSFLLLTSQPSKEIRRVSSKTVSLQLGVNVYDPSAPNGKITWPAKLEVATPPNRCTPSKTSVPVAPNGPATGPAVKKPCGCVTQGPFMSSGVQGVAARGSSP